uniref:CHCH domain-containing protein n=1 Tax=Neospora caninum (strain Liverpool) TaxID=572307 RepID=A0A0F7U5P2_NEOCL|nr:TPA: hypothetical protein BN1204_002995 [Neospora caninum Liverpool]
MAAENEMGSQRSSDLSGKQPTTIPVDDSRNISKSGEVSGTVPISRAQMSKYWGDDVDDKVERTGCSEPYGRLVDCLDVYDKDWRKCREELQEFRRCCREKKVPGA